MRFVRSTRCARRLRRLDVLGLTSEAGGCARRLQGTAPAHPLCRGRATRIQARGGRVDGSATRPSVVGSAHPLACCGLAFKLAKCGYRTRAARLLPAGLGTPGFFSSPFISS